MTMKRYDHVFQKNSGSREMCEVDDGEWIRHDDVDFELSRQAQEIERLRAENARLSNQLYILSKYEERLRKDNQKLELERDNSNRCVMSIDHAVDVAAGDRTYRGELIDDIRRIIEQYSFVDTAPSAD